MRYDSDHKARTRERLIDAGASIVKQNGAEALTIRAATEALALTPGGFYAHFGSRDEFVALSIARAFAQNSAATLLGSIADPHMAITRFVDAYLSLDHLAERSRCCPLPALLSEAARLPARSRQCFLEELDRLAALLADRLRQSGHLESERLAGLALIRMAATLAVARSREAAPAEALLAAACVAVKSDLSPVDKSPAEPAL